MIDHITLATLVSLLPLLSAPQDPAEGRTDETGPTTDEVLRAAAPEARAAWERMIAAARPAEPATSPITAFVLKASVIFRDGVKHNELEGDYRYLAPHFIRFKLRSQRETGRGPGKGDRGYWLKDGEEVLRLVGRESREDRRQVDEMLAIARNFVALSDLTRLRLTRLETLAEPPQGLPAHARRTAKKLDWLRVASPDFALLQEQLRAPATDGRGYLADLALNRATGLPSWVIVREEKERSADGVLLPSNPMLIELRNWQPSPHGFLVPRWVLVYRMSREPGVVGFADRAAQDIELREIDLRPTLTEADFEPR